MKASLYFSILFLLTITILLSLKKDLPIQKHTINAILNKPIPNKIYDVAQNIKLARIYVNKHQLDTSLALLINYRRHSGTKRAYLINLSQSLVIDSFLVSHGCGNQPWGNDFSKDSAIFSNELESHCTSLGHYKIGKRATSAWGIHIKYFLHGMDASNSNAYTRQIVLHGWEIVPDLEVYPYGTAEGWGCPAFSNNAMKILDSTFQTKQKPILLWAY